VGRQVSSFYLSLNVDSKEPVSLLLITGKYHIQNIKIILSSHANCNTMDGE